MTVGGDGGMVVTDKESIAQSVMSLRDCGRTKGSKYLHDLVGYTERLNTVQAAIGRVQLKHLDAWNGKRKQVAYKYNELLSDVKELITPPEGNTLVNPVHHMYVVRCEQRDNLKAWLDQAGVETGIHYAAPIHLQPIYKKMYGYIGGEFPNSETLSKGALSIPMHPGLTTDEVTHVSESIHEFYARKNRTSPAR
jgi:dTDP-4-amino-4,6-dideoxygalactose transaminase